MFSVIEFKESDGGGVCIVNSKWLTPRKQEVYWPPIKDNLKFEKVIRKVDHTIDSTWELYPVQRIFYTCDDFEKAKEKRNKAQVTSDVKTDSEIEYTGHNNRRSKRQRKPCNVYTDSESSDSDSHILSKLGNKKKKLPRPPIIHVSGSESVILPNQEEAHTDTDTFGGRDLIDVTSKGKYPTEFHALSNSPGTSSCISGIGDENNSQINTETCQGKNLISVTPKVRHPMHIHTLSLNSPGTSSVNKLRCDTSLDDIELQHPVLNALLKNILTVKEQNRQILDILKKKDIPISTALPANLDVTLPVETLEDLEKLESYLQAGDDFKSFVSFCISISNCKDLTQKTNRILRSLVKDTVAKQFNYFGTNRLNKGTDNKRAFNQLMLNKVVQGEKFTKPYVK